MLKLVSKGSADPTLNAQFDSHTYYHRILARWHDEVRQFVKVFPKDYKRVLEAVRLAEEQGRDVDEAIMAAAHG